jgi:hypothetical protein
MNILELLCGMAFKDEYLLNISVAFYIECRDQVASSLFFQYNEALGPPYHIIIDTNFINFSIQNKLDVMKSMMDCLFAKCTARSNIVLLSCNDNFRLTVKCL